MNNRRRIARSYLFVPGNRPERFAKARAAGADAVILDLEDSVPPSEKEGARANVADFLKRARSMLVRINGPDTEWFESDVQACRNAAGILLPKAERAADISRIGSEISAVTSILPIVETARGLWNALELAQAESVQRLVFGSIDLQLDLDITGEAEELLLARSRLVLASRVAGIQAPVDGVNAGIDDLQALESDARRARRMGFGGKLCIHPKQVATINEAFSPSAVERTWARRIIGACEKAGGAAVAMDGRMVDKPVLIRAQRILGQAQGSEK